jgi:hypothetical protein
LLGRWIAVSIALDYGLGRTRILLVAIVTFPHRPSGLGIEEQTLILGREERVGEQISRLNTFYNNLGQGVLVYYFEIISPSFEFNDLSLRFPKNLRFVFISEKVVCCGFFVVVTAFKSLPTPFQRL